MQQFHPPDPHTTFHLNKLIESEYIGFYHADKSLLSQITCIEQEEDNHPYILPYSPERLLHVIEHPDEQCIIVKAKLHHEMVGFIILAGLQNPHLSLEFRRIVISEKGKGFGRACLRLVKRYCFEELGFHRLWLDVFEYNERALYLYKSEGFKEEGFLRECVKTPQGYQSLRILSMLSNEYN